MALACSIRALGSLLEVRPVSVCQLAVATASCQASAIIAGWSETKHGEGTNLPDDTMRKECTKRS